MPSDAEVKRIWLDMLKWIQHNVPQQSTTIVHAGAAAPGQKPTVR
jgi:hypothetical protein